MPYHQERVVGQRLVVERAEQPVTVIIIGAQRHSAGYDSQGCKCRCMDNGGKPSSGVHVGFALTNV